MAQRFYSEIYSTHGTLYRVELHDSTLSIDIDVEIEVGEIEITTDKAQDKVWEPIKRTRCTLNWLIKNSTEKGVLETMAQTQESRYYIKVFRDPQLIFFGRVQTDLLTIENAALPFYASLVCTDGFEVLKEKKEAVSYKSGLDLIMQMLRLTDTGELIADTDPFLTTAVRYFPEQISYVQTINPFARWRPSSSVPAFKDPKKDQWYTHYQILERILHTFGAQLRQAQGRWWISHHPELVGGNAYVHVYAKNYDPGTSLFVGESGVITNGSLLDLSFEDELPELAQVLEGVTYGFNPRLKRASRRFNFNGSYTIFSGQNIDLTTAYSFGQVVMPSVSSYLLIVLEMRIELSNPGSFSLVRPIEFKATTKLDDGVSVKYFGAALWQTAPFTASYYASTAQLIPNGVTSVFTFQMSITTPVLVQGGELFLEYELEPMVGVTIVDEVAVVASVQHIPSDLSAAYGFEYQVEDASGTSSATEELPEIYLGDGPTPVSNAKLQAFNGSAWANTTRWRFENSGTYYPIQTLVLQEVLRLFSAPRLRFDMTLTGTMESINILLYESKYLAWNSYKAELASGKITGEMIEIDRVTTDFDDLDDSLYDAGLLPAPATPQGNSATVGVSFGKLTAQATGTVTEIEVEELGVDALTAGAKILVYAPGTGAAVEFELAADWDGSTTTLTVVEQEVTAELPEGASIYLEPKALMNALSRRVSGYLAGLSLAASKIGGASEAVEIDTATGDMRLDGTEITFPNIPTEETASVGQLCLGSSGFLKIKQ